MKKFHISMKKVASIGVKGIEKGVSILSSLSALEIFRTENQRRQQFWILFSGPDFSFKSQPFPEIEARS